jgi:hypothetical protein
VIPVNQKTDRQMTPSYESPAHIGQGAAQTRAMSMGNLVHNSVSEGEKTRTSHWTMLQIEPGKISKVNLSPGQRESMICNA